MKNIKRKLAAIIMTGFLMATTTFAKTGLLMSDFAGEEPTCTQTNDSVGIIITGFTGIIITGFTGIIITGAAETTSECGE